MHVEGKTGFCVQYDPVALIHFPMFLAAVSHNFGQIETDKYCWSKKKKKQTYVHVQDPEFLKITPYRAILTKPHISFFCRRQ